MFPAYPIGMFRTLLLLTAVTISISASAGAAELVVAVSGQFSSSDVASSFVAPNGVFSLSFDVNSSPVPVAGSVTGLGFDVPIAGFSYSLNGAAASPAPVTEIRFNTSANGGLFDVTIGSGLSATEFDFQGDQLFSGSTAAPAISAGQYGITSWTVSDPNNFDVQTPAAASAVVTTPEPSSWLLFSVAMLLLIAPFRRTLTSIRS
jgi:hypothetical protein